MASPNAIFTEIVSTTFRNHGADFADNVSKHNALYRKFKTGGRTRKESGGYTIVQGLEYAANGTYQRYSAFDVLNISQSDVLSAAEFNWRQIAISIVASGFELRINHGPQKIANLAKLRMRNALNTFANNFSSDMYADGTLPNQITGLQAMVADAGTGTIGGIDSSAWPFWQNVVQSAAAPLQGGGAITPGPTTMESLMLPLFMKLTRNADKPRLIVMSDDYFSFYEQSQTSIKRYVGSDSADGGFMELSYKGVPVVFDGASGMAASHAYFLNTDYMELVVHEQANLTPLEEDARPYNQDAAVTPIIWMGNMVCANRSLQGVMKA